VAGNQDAYERAMDCQALLDDTDHLALDPAGGDTAHGVFGHLIDYESCHLHWAWRPRKMWSETFTSKLGVCIPRRCAVFWCCSGAAMLR
jgi:hypothetical protein